MEKILQVKNIEKYYGNKSNLTKAIDNISFEVNKGEFVGIMGASGSRKNDFVKLPFYHRSSNSWAYYHQSARYYQAKRQPAKQIQKRRTGVYFSGF